MPRLSVTKTHGARNDILVVDGAPDDHIAAPEVERAVRRLCDRVDGLGGDGVYFVADTGDGEVRAWFYNPDGSPALLCGNGMRGVGRILLDRHRSSTAVVHTGRYAFTVRDAGTTPHGVRQVSVELPPIDFAPAAPVVAGAGGAFVDRPLPAYHPLRTVTAAAAPNSHLVSVVDAYDEADLIATGTRVAADAATFPIGANVSYVQRLGEAEVFVRTFERGAGLTPSCGSGVCAARAVLSRLGLVEPAVPVVTRNPGGPSRTWLRAAADGLQPVLEGNATLVYRTEVDVRALLAPERPGASRRLEVTGEVFADEAAAFEALAQENLKVLHTAGISPALG